MSTSLGGAHHGAWNVRQGGAGVNTDTAIVHTNTSWHTFPNLILPQYDAVMQGPHMYCVYTFRQSGVDDNNGWFWAWLIAQPMRDTNGAKSVWWKEVTGDTAWHGASWAQKYFAYTDSANGTQTSLLGYFKDSVKIYDGTTKYIVIDHYYGNDTPYKWKGTFSSL